MIYTVSMVLVGELIDVDEGVPTEPLPGSFPTVDAANDAGNAEIVRRQAKPGTITFKVFDKSGKEVDEAGLGLS